MMLSAVDPSTGKAATLTPPRAAESNASKRASSVSNAYLPPAALAGGGTEPREARFRLKSASQFSDGRMYARLELCNA
jgi:hypothetical protein